MKKTVITVFILLVVVSGWWYVRNNLYITLSELEGETALLHRGDITIPITASGKIVPLWRKEIKSKASGKVDLLPVKAGDLVKKDGLLVQLDPVDEQRNRDRFKAEYDRAKIALERAKVAVEDAKTEGIATADATAEEIKANLDRGRYVKQKTERLKGEDQSSKDEWNLVCTRVASLEAQYKVAVVRATQSRTAVKYAELDRAATEAAYTSAEAAWLDAEQRLKETRVLSPSDGMVTTIETRPGQMIQSGTQSLMGGTILMYLANVSEWFVEARVDEADIGRVIDLAPTGARPGHRRATIKPVSFGDPGPVPVGSPVKVTVEAYPGEEFTGEIDQVYPEPDSLSNVVTYTVKIRITSENRNMLMLGMQADVEFTAESSINVVLVPHEAIKRGPSGELGVWVPVRGDDSREQKRRFVKVEFGLDNGIDAEATSDLGSVTEVYTKLPKLSEREMREQDED